MQKLPISIQSFAGTLAEEKRQVWSKIDSSSLAIIKTHRLMLKFVAAKAATNLLH